MRKVLPISMIFAAALAGCTMNRTPGDGQPVTTTPSMSPATTPGTSYGNTPMSSSYAEPSASRADQAAAIMREHQAYQPRLLGYLNPEPRAQQAGAQYADTGGQFVNPAMSANPQLTVNSSISSAPYPVITGGSDGFVVSGPATGTTATSSATVAPSTVGTTATTPTTNAATLTPTLTSGATVTPTLATSPLTSMASASGGTVLTTGTSTVGRTTTQTTAASTVTGVRSATASLTLPASGATPLTVTTTPGGQIMISNVHR